MQYRQVRKCLPLCIAVLSTAIDLARADPLTLSPSYLQAAATTAESQASNAQNEANNPLTPKITLNLHNYYTPDTIDTDDEANSLLFRGLVPHKLFGLPQLFRFTLPLSTVPTFPDGDTSGFGDLTLMDLFVFKAGKLELGIGPQLVIPTSNREEISSEKWQAGPAAILIAPQEWGIVGGIATHQQSFAGSDSRDDVSLATFQPLVIFNLPGHFYLRSSATWNFDLNAGTYFIPVGAGVGKIFELNDKITMNLFIEPQYTVFHDGQGMPEWQIFAGVNFQFALK